MEKRAGNEDGLWKAGRLFSFLDRLLAQCLLIFGMSNGL